MGLLKTGVTILDFDETYNNQRKLQRYSQESIDLQNLKHVNLYCENDALISLYTTLRQRRQRGITFIGSGNYHYVSYLLMNEINKPFTLVLFDNHPDLGIKQDQSANLLSCGSWVSFALKKIPLLKRVIIIGPTTLIAESFPDARVVIFPFTGEGQYSPKSILTAIHTENIYISIDKDVLNSSEAATNWDQGIMTISLLTDFLNELLKNKQVVGVDICGEAHFTPLQTYLPDYQMMIRKNENANLQILETCLKWGGHQSKGA